MLKRSLIILGFCLLVSGCSKSVVSEQSSADFGESESIEETSKIIKEEK